MTTSTGDTTAAGQAGSVRAAPPLPAGVRVGYATGSLVTGAFGTVPGLLLGAYLTDTLGVAAGLAGLLILLPKAWDVLLNPVAGRLSDRTTTRWGARRPYLLVGGLALAVLFPIMFAGVFTGGAGAVWVTFAFLAAATAFAFFQVPYVAMPAEMTDGYAERTRMMTWRVSFLALAILVSGALAPVIRDAAGGGIPGYRAVGVFVAVMIVVGTLCVFFLTRDAPTGRVQESEPSLRAQLSVARANRPFRVLVACFVVQAAGVGTMLAGVQYFADHVLHRHDATSILFVCVVAPAILVMPLWSRVGARLGKLRGYVVASLLLTVGTFALVGARVLPAAAVYAIAALVGIGYGGQQLFSLAMLPDTIAFDTARTGRRQAGVFTGLWTAGETLGLAIGPGLFLLVLELFGYRSGTAGEAVPQSATAELGVLLGFTLVPGVIVGLALLFLRAYDLTEQRLAEAVPS